MTGVAVVLVGVALAGYLYVQSASFQRTLVRTLSSLSGGEVELDGRVSIERLFPQVRVSAPGAKLRNASSLQGVERARLQGLQVSLSPRVLLSGGESGKVAVQLDALALIIDRSAAPMQAELPLLPSAFAPTLSDQVGQAVRDAFALAPTLLIDEVNVIVREDGEASRHLRLQDVQVAAERDAFDLAARYGAPDAIRGHWQARVDGIDTDTDDGALALRIESETRADDPGRDASVKPADTDEPAEPAQRFSTAVRLHGNRVQLRELEYRGELGWLRGDLSVDAGTEDVVVKADLELRQLTLSSDMLGSDAPGERVFPYTPLSFAVPANLRADVKLQLGAVRLDRTPLVSGALALQVEGGRATLAGDDLQLLGGSSDLSVSVETAYRGLLDAALKLESDDIQLERLRSRTDASPMLSQGRADLIVSLQGSGPSLGHVAASLDGYVTAAVDDARINRTYSTLIDRGIIRWGADKLIGLSGRAENASGTRLKDPLRITCAALRFYINDGRVEASNGAVFELPENTLFSSGFVDFSDESLGFVFRSRTRSLFDWSALSFVKYAEIRGSLSAPLVTLNTTELAKQGLRSASSMVWGPLPGLVYSLAESGIRNRQDMSCDPSIR